MYSQNSCKLIFFCLTNQIFVAVLLACIRATVLFHVWSLVFIWFVCVSYLKGGCCWRCEETGSSSVGTGSCWVRTPSTTTVDQRKEPADWARWSSPTSALSSGQTSRRTKRQVSGTQTGWCIADSRLLDVYFPVISVESSKSRLCKFPMRCCDHRSFKNTWEVVLGFLWYLNDILWSPFPSHECCKSE